MNPTPDEFPESYEEGGDTYELVMPAPTRLSDALVDNIANHSHPDPLIKALAREVQATRALLYGGPCPDCYGRGSLVTFNLSVATDGPCPNPDCKNGRTEGLAERLLAAMETTGTGTAHYHAVAAIIADLRREEPTDG